MLSVSELWPESLRAWRAARSTFRLGKVRTRTRFQRSHPSPTNTRTSKMSQIDFSYLVDSLETDSSLRESIREQARQVEREERTIQASLNRIQALTQQDSK